MYKHILVAVDGSDTSNLALQEAMKLAKEQQAALRLIHVVDETPVYMTMGHRYIRWPIIKRQCVRRAKRCWRPAPRRLVKLESKSIQIRHS